VLFLKRTSPLDRVAIGILLLYAVFRVAAFNGHAFPLSFVVGFLSFLSIVYFLIRVVPWLRSHFMWRLRNRLIVAYIFIAVVPVFLLLTMVGVASYLLYLEFGAHMLHDDFQDRVSLIAADAEAISGAIGQETLKGATTKDEAVLARPSVASAIEAARADWPGLRVRLNHGAHLLQLGDGRHFSGLVESERKLWFVAVERQAVQPNPELVEVKAPLTSDVLDKLKSDLGPIQLTLFQRAGERPLSGLTYESNGISYVSGDQVVSRRRTLGQATGLTDVRVNGGSIFEVNHLDSEGEVAPAPVLASFVLRPSALNRRLFTSVGALGPMLVMILLIVGIIFLALEIVALATGVVLTRTITRSVADLYDATLHVRRGDFSHRIRVKQRDQLGALGESFNEMTASVSELIEEQRQRQRLENEISIAREVQEQLFPHSIPSVEGLQLAAICKPARVVSGDYYDFIRLSPSRVGIALADISGKGIFAALLMASLQAALRSTAMLDGKGGTAELVSRLNNHVFRNTSDDRYATFFYAVYDSEAKTITYTNAGHLPPWFVTEDGAQALDEGGTVVGLFEDCPFTQRTLHVAPGSILVAFSDGLTEPENVYGEEFGSQRLKQEILRQRQATPRRMAEDLIAAAEQWAGTPEQADDMTVVVARMG
jgi:sigma-B regulation protein RsbU (phosphoserine phosphatase)